MNPEGNKYNRNIQSMSYDKTAQREKPYWRDPYLFRKPIDRTAPNKYKMDEYYKAKQENYAPGRNFEVNPGNRN